MVHSVLDRVQDNALVLRPAAAAAISSATTTNETSIVDLGLGTHRFDIIFDVTTFDVAGADDIATIRVQGSADGSASFASPEMLAVLVIGNATAIASTGNRGTGEYVLPCHNLAKVSNVDTAMRYVRLSTITAGATVSLDYVAYISKRT